MKFREYVIIKNPIGSFRAKMFVCRFNLKGNDTYESLRLRDGIGKRSAYDILKLQYKFRRKTYNVGN